MKLQDPKREHAPFDVAPGLAAGLLAQGFHEIKAVEIPKAAGELKWWVTNGPIVGDYQYMPMLRYSCGVCGTKGEVESPLGLAHKNTKVFHCGLRGNICTPDVAADYERRWAAWKARSKKPPVEKVSPHTPAHVVSRFGLKRREDLISEAVSAVAQLVKGPTKNA